MVLEKSYTLNIHIRSIDEKKNVMLLNITSCLFNVTGKCILKFFFWFCFVSLLALVRETPTRPNDQPTMCVFDDVLMLMALFYSLKKERKRKSNLFRRTFPRTTPCIPILALTYSYAFQWISTKRFDSATGFNFVVFLSFQFILW